jgi:hypothetical protein
MPAGLKTFPQKIDAPPQKIASLSKQTRRRHGFGEIWMKKILTSENIRNS